MKEEALKLLDKWDSIGSSRDTLLWAADAYAMIRRLVEELDKQNPSMFTILSCGCKSEFMGFPSEWCGETRECEPCVNYGSLCEQHFMEYEARPAQYTQQTKPLSDDEILHIYSETYRNTLMGIDPLAFAREIEERHGIK